MAGFKFEVPQRYGRSVAVSTNYNWVSFVLSEVCAGYFRNFDLVVEGLGPRATLG